MEFTKYKDDSSFKNIPPPYLPAVQLRTVIFVSIKKARDLPHNPPPVKFPVLESNTDPTIYTAE